MITAAITQARILSQAGLTRSPMIVRSPVNFTSGTTAKGSCRLSTTWLSTSSLVAPPSPVAATTNTAGTIALGLAFFINAAILILAAATFHVAGRTDVADIDQAHALLAPMLGMGAASVVFAVALLASGQNSTVTGTLAGQIVMEGFLNLRMPVWARRLVTRLLAIIPAVFVVGAAGDAGATRLLVLSQVVLSLQLPFAVVPLVKFTGDARIMGSLVSPVWLKALAWVIAAVIIGLNATLLIGML